MRVDVIDTSVEGVLGATARGVREGASGCALRGAGVASACAGDARRVC